MYLEDFDVTFKYIEGNKNILADCFSILPRMEKASCGKSSDKGTLIDFTKLEVPKDEDNVSIAMSFQLFYPAATMKIHTSLNAF